MTHHHNPAIAKVRDNVSYQITLRLDEPIRFGCKRLPDAKLLAYTSCLAFGCATTVKRLTDDTNYETYGKTTIKNVYYDLVGVFEPNAGSARYFTARKWQLHNQQAA